MSPWDGYPNIPWNSLTEMPLVADEQWLIELDLQIDLARNPSYTHHSVYGTNTISRLPPTSVMSHPSQMTTFPPPAPFANKTLLTTNNMTDGLCSNNAVSSPTPSLKHQIPKRSDIKFTCISDPWFDLFRFLNVNNIAVTQNPQSLSRLRLYLPKLS